MAYTTVYKDVVFIEGEHKTAQKKSKIEASLGGIGAQLKTINDVKTDLARKAKFLGCNCVVEFKYGQKSSWLAFDDVKYYGKGVAAVLEEEEYKKIVEEKS